MQVVGAVCCDQGLLEAISKSWRFCCVLFEAAQDVAAKQKRTELCLLSFESITNAVSATYASTGSPLFIYTPSPALQDHYGLLL
jgi:hypothetical protein